MSASKTAFVMMPFASEFDDVYQSLIREPLIAAGYEVFRCDDLLNQVNILQDIVGSIARSSLLVADLSTSNPNVYYELGLSHALKRPVILFAQDIDEVPFDLRSYRIIQYATHFAKMNQAITAFTALLKGIDDGSISFGSPVSDFGALESSAGGLNRTSTLAVSSEVGADFGLLDFKEALDDGAATMAKTMEEVGARLRQLNPNITSTTEQLTSGRSASTKAHRNLMRALAVHIDKEATWLRSANARYKWALENVGNALNAILSGEFEVSGFSGSSLQEFVDTLLKTEAQALVSRDQFAGLAATVDSLPRIEKEFGRANRLFSAEIKEFVGNIDQTVAVFTRARNAAAQLMDAKVVSSNPA